MEPNKTLFASLTLGPKTRDNPPQEFSTGVRLSGTIELTSGRITLPGDSVLSACPHCRGYILQTRDTLPEYSLRKHSEACSGYETEVGMNTYSYGELFVEGDKVSVVGNVCPEAENESR